MMTNQIGKEGMKTKPMISTRSGIVDLRCRSPVGTGALAPLPCMPSIRVRNP